MEITFTLKSIAKAADSKRLCCRPQGREEELKIIKQLDGGVQLALF